MSSTRNLVDSIISDNLNEASENLSESFVEILKQKLVEAKKIVAAKYDIAELAEQIENMNECNVINNGRFKIIKARIRAGKVQRRVKRSAVPGMTIRGGKLIRMTQAEKRARKMGARRAKVKRRAKLFRALQKRKRSMMKRKALGIR